MYRIRNIFFSARLKNRHEEPLNNGKDFSDIFTQNIKNNEDEAGELKYGHWYGGDGYIKRDEKEDSDVEGRGLGR